MWVNVVTMMVFCSQLVAGSWDAHAEAIMRSNKKSLILVQILGPDGGNVWGSWSPSSEPCVLRPDAQEISLLRQHPSSITFELGGSFTFITDVETEQTGRVISVYSNPKYWIAVSFGTNSGVLVGVEQAFRNQAERAADKGVEYLKLIGL